MRASGDRHTASLLDYIGEINNKKFASERNQELKDDPLMELSDLSYGSVHEKKEKFISLEAKKYIHELVTEVKG